VWAVNSGCRIAAEPGRCSDAQEFTVLVPFREEGKRLRFFSMTAGEFFYLAVWEGARKSVYLPMALLPDMFAAAIGCVGQLLFLSFMSRVTENAEMKLFSHKNKRNEYESENCCTCQASARYPQCG
jgi:hypothetical protein